MKHFLMGIAAVCVLAFGGSSMAGAAQSTVAPLQEAQSMTPAPQEQPMLTPAAGYMDAYGNWYGNICYLPPNGANWCVMNQYGPVNAPCTCFVNGYAYGGRVGT